MDQRETEALLVLPETMAFPDSPAFPDPLAHLDLPALAETLLLRCLVDLTISPAACPSPDQWAQWVPVVPLDLLVQAALRVSLAPLVSLVRLVPLAPWDPVVLLDPLGRTERMVSLANLVVMVSADPLALRELVDSLEPLDFLESRDTEDSVV